MERERERERGSWKWNEKVKRGQKLLFQFFRALIPGAVEPSGLTFDLEKDILGGDATDAWRFANVTTGVARLDVNDLQFVVVLECGGRQTAAIPRPFEANELVADRRWQIARQIDAGADEDRLLFLVASGDHTRGLFYWFDMHWPFVTSFKTQSKKSFNAIQCLISRHWMTNYIKQPIVQSNWNVKKICTRQLINEIKISVDNIFKNGTCAVWIYFYIWPLLGGCSRYSHIQSGRGKIGAVPLFRFLNPGLAIMGEWTLINQIH